MSVITPMFPLGTVVLPGTALPLQIFEPRYVALLRHCMENEPIFGVVLIERGSEVGGGDVRTAIGSMVRIAQAQEVAPGRFAVLSIATTRIRVERWLPDDPYPLAEVEPWDDPQPGPAITELRQANDRRLTTVLALAAELGEARRLPGGELPEFADDPVVAGYQAASLAPLGPLDRQRLLAAPTPDEREALLGELLDDAAAVLRFRLGA